MVVLPRKDQMKTVVNSAEMPSFQKSDSEIILQSINSERTKIGRSTLFEDQKLCEYANLLASVYKIDSTQGSDKFNSDLKNVSMKNAYFTNYSYLNRYVFNTLSQDPQEIAGVMYGDVKNTQVLSPKITGACVAGILNSTGDKWIIVFIGAGK